MSIQSLSVTSAAIRNPSRAAVTGGYNTTFSTVKTIACRIQPMSVKESVLWGKDTDTVLAVLYAETPLTTLITNESQILADSITYEVLGKRDFDRLSRLTRVDMMELRDQ